MDVPTLHTDRLVLLPLGPADLDETAALYADPEVMRFVVNGVMDRAATARCLDQVAEHWRVHGHGLWAIREASTGAFLGEGGLQRFSLPDGLALDVTNDMEVDFGYTLCRRGWGQGYATEAGSALLDDAWSRYRGPRIHALVTTDNLQSQRVLEKLGFTRTAVDPPDGGDQHQLWVADRP